MNRRLLQLGLFALFAVQVLADNIPEDAARSIASKFITGDNRMRKAQATTTTLSLATTTKGYYAYNIGKNAGFVLVATDDNVTNTVLGYSDYGTFDANTLPENVRWWLSEYDRQVELAAKLTKQNGGFKIARSGSSDGQDYPLIDPLITSKWNQDSPYNDMCPETNGKHGLTGCVATALAQIMRYHRWPEKGTGSISYKWEAGETTLIRDFSSHTYDYDAMTDTYDKNSSQESKDAVALLMADVGYAIQMQYTPDVSNAYNSYGVRGLVNHMGYANGASFQMRNYYSKDEWNDMIYSELAASRPVYYSGRNKDAGHAFVCDGYNGNGYFHFNWGWGGYCDGNFLLTVVDPGSQQGLGGSSDGYAIDQQVIIGMQRDAKEVVPNMTMDNPISITPKKALRTGSATITSAGKNYGSVGFNPIKATLGVKVVGNDSSVVYVPSSTTVSLKYWENATDSILTINLSSFPKENGTYGVYPAYRDDASGKWYDMKHLQNEGVFSLVATVKGDSISFGETSTKMGSVVATDLTVDKKLGAFEKRDFYCDMKISCSDNEFCDNLILGLAKGNKVYAYNMFFCNLSAGEKQAFSVRITAPEAGEYTLLALQKVGDGYEDISNGVPVTVENAPTGTVSVTNFSTSTTPYAGNKFTITATVECSKGDYNAPIKAICASAEDGTILGRMGYERVNMTNGETRMVQIECTAPSIAAQYQIAFMNYENKQISGSYDFTVEEKPLDILTLAQPLTIDGQDGGVNPELVQLKTMVKCNRNEYIGQLAAFFYNEKDSVVDQLISQLNISNGDSTNVTFAGKCSNLKPGATYTAKICYAGEADGKWQVMCDKNGKAGSVTFTVQEASGIAAAKDAKATERISIYTVSGALLDNQTGAKPDLSTLPSGIYIIKVGEKTYKTAR